MTAESQTRSVPGWGCRKTSARSAISFLRRSETMSFWPRSLCASLDARGQHRMAFRGVAADDEDQVGLLDIGDGAGIAAVADGAKQPDGCRGLAIARAVVHVVGADHGARELLHQIALFVGALRGRDEGERIGAGSGLDFSEPASDQ